MINSKETLKRLHKKFPLMSLDELFEILDCVVEESFFKYEPSKDSPFKTWTGDNILYDNKITSSDSVIRTYSGDLYESNGVSNTLK